MLKKIILGVLISSSLFSQNFIGDFFKYSTAYSSFSLNAPRYRDDRFAIVGGLSTGDLLVERTERDFKHHLDFVRLEDFNMNRNEV